MLGGDNTRKRRIRRSIGLTARHRLRIVRCTEYPILLGRAHAAAHHGADPSSSCPGAPICGRRSRRAGRGRVATSKPTGTPPRESPAPAATRAEVGNSERICDASILPAWLRSRKITEEHCDGAADLDGASSGEEGMRERHQYTLVYDGNCDVCTRMVEQLRSGIVPALMSPPPRIRRWPSDFRASFRPPTTRRCSSSIAAGGRGRRRGDRQLLEVLPRSGFRAAFASECARG
jgi:hypothetical protein